MVKVDDKYVDGFLLSFLQQLNKAVEDKWDGLFYIGGMEGAGKTTIAMQCAKLLNPKFSMKNVVFGGEDFVNACINAKPKTAIVFDESYNVFNNRNFANKLTNRIISMLTMIRSKQLFIIIVSPTFFDLSKYLIVHRSRAFINVYSKDMKRGFFSFYNYDKKFELYHKGKKNHNMYCVNPLFRGRFTKWSPVDLDEYEQRKQDAIRELALDKGKKTGETISLENIEKHKNESVNSLILYLKKFNLLKFGALKKIAENYLEITPRALDHRTRDLKNSRK